MSSLPKFEPMELIQFPAPFDDPDFLYEVKFGGFRAMAYVEDGHCELVSRKGHTYKRFQELAEGIARERLAFRARCSSGRACRRCTAASQRSRGGAIST